jgi:hypothetical protein
MEKPCEVYLLHPQYCPKTRHRILESGGIPDSVREWSVGGDETPADTSLTDEEFDSISDRIFSIALAVIVSGLIVCVGYWVARL